MKVSDIITLVAALVGVAAIWFSYQAWEAYAGKPFASEQERARGIAEYRGPSAQTRSPLIPTRISRTNQLQVETETRTQIETEIAGLVSQVQELNASNQALAEEILAATTRRQSLEDTQRDKRAELNRNQERVRELSEALMATGEPQELRRRVQDNVTRLRQADEDLITQRNLLEETLRRRESHEGTLDSLRQTARMQASGQMDPSFSSSIREVYGRWGFVTIGAGANQGVNARSALQVVRDGEVVASLRVSTVEPTSAVAAIEPDSLLDGISLRPGDLVRVSPESVPSPDQAAN